MHICLFDIDGTLIASAGAGKAVIALPDAGGGEGGVAFSPDGLTLVIAGGKDFRLWGPTFR